MLLSSCMNNVHLLPVSLMMLLLLLLLPPLLLLLLLTFCYGTSILNLLILGFLLCVTQMTFLFDVLKSIWYDLFGILGGFA